MPDSAGPAAAAEPAAVPPEAPGGAALPPAPGPAPAQAKSPWEQAQVQMAKLMKHSNTARRQALAAEAYNFSDKVPSDLRTFADAADQLYQQLLQMTRCI